MMSDDVQFDVIVEHAEEMAFLWQLRQYAVVAPHFSLQRLEDLDDRISAHLDGLRIAGRHGWEACDKALDGATGGEIFTAAVLALESGAEDRISRVTKAATKSPELSRGLSSALGWMGMGAAEAQASALLEAESPVLRRAGIAAFAVARTSPPRLIDLLAASDGSVRARALRSVGELGRQDVAATVYENLDHPDRECRFWASWATVMLGGTRGTSSLESYAKSNDPLGDAAAVLLMLTLPSDRALLLREELASTPAQIRRSIVATAALGRFEDVDGLIEQMASPVLARAAGEAFTTITGIPIVGELEGRRPDDLPQIPSEDPGDERVEMDPDEDLNFPAVSALADHWRKVKATMQTRDRCLLGSPISKYRLKEILRNGLQRQRALAAQHLAATFGGVLFETRAPASHQRAALSEDRQIEAS